MQLIKTQTVYRQNIKKLAVSKPKYFYFATFGLTVDKYLDGILKALPKNCDVRILIGVKPTCTKKQIDFFKYYFRNYKLKISKSSHLKMVATNNGSLMGGMNYTNSDWADSAWLMKLPKACKLTKNYFEVIWKSKRSS